MTLKWAMKGRSQGQGLYVHISVVYASRTFNSTKGRATILGTGVGGCHRVGGGWGGTRRRCMKAKALQTIVTLYMTSSCYNNTAVIYCTVQVRLNIWLDKADHHYQSTISINNISFALILFFSFLFFFFDVFFFKPFPTLCHLCFCS